MLCTVLGLCASLAGQAYVRDGDTIYIDHQSIRLYGIDAEELDEPYGYRAKYALESLIAKQPVTCKDTGQRSHRRIVARCYLPDGRELNKIMVEQGHVLDCGFYSNGEYRQHEPDGARSRIRQKAYCYFRR